MQTNFLTSANVGNIATNAQNEVRKTINDRWERLGFTAGLTFSQDIGFTASLTFRQAIGFATSLTFRHII